MELGIFEVRNSRKCGIHYSCKNSAKYYIGDKNKPQDPHNMFLCEDHLQLLYNKLQERYGINAEPQNTTLNESNTDDKANSQELTNKYLEMLYNSGGMTNKEKLKEFCTENEIELPKDVDELKTKGYMELIFPILKEEKWLYLTK